MPEQPTKEQVVAALQKLPAEQHAGFLAEVERRLNKAKGRTRQLIQPGTTAINLPMSSATGMLLPIPSISDPREVESGVQAASGTAAVTGAVVAAPMTMAKMTGLGATQMAVSEGTHAGLKKIGVNDTIADWTGDAVGLAATGGLGGGLALARGMFGKEARSKAFAVLAQLFKGKAKKETAPWVVNTVEKALAEGSITESGMLRLTAELTKKGATQAEIKAALKGVEVVTKKAAPAAKVVKAAAPAPVTPKAAPRPLAEPPSPKPASPTGRSIDPPKGVDFNRAGGSKAQRAAVEAKAAFEGRGLKPGPGWAPQGSYEPSKAVVKAAKKGLSPGAIRTAQHKKFVEFVKNNAPDAKTGEKVWLELNKAGDPIRVMTPGQASHVAGPMKTWLKKIGG